MFGSCLVSTLRPVKQFKRATCWPAATSSIRPHGACELDNYIANQDAECEREAKRSFIGAMGREDAIEGCDGAPLGPTQEEDIVDRSIYIYIYI